MASTLESREREMIEAALTACNGQVSGARGAAVTLGIPRQTLDSRIASLNIDKHCFKKR
jgi:formate hydrogenlyase transcriptional activator